MSEKTPTLKLVKPSTDAQRITRTTMDTLEITPDIVNAWTLPPFQRQLKVNDKVLELAKKIKRDDGVIPGTLVLGVLDKVQYLIDGQHRRHAFILSECAEGYADVRVCHFKTMAEMGEEFGNVNQRLVPLKPDDLLRAYEATSEGLSHVRRECPWIGYDQIRRNPHSPIVSMSAILRCWFGSAPEAPSMAHLVPAHIVDLLSMEEAQQLLAFAKLAMQSWGRDAEYQRLWLNLNLVLSMWMYRRLVVSPYSTKTPKLSHAEFAKCLMALSADSTYLSWLVGRTVRERDRSPAYTRMKTIFAHRIEAETGKKPLLPSPAWSGGKGGIR